MRGPATSSSSIENAAPQHYRDFAERTVVAAPNQFPYRAIGQITIELRDGRRRHGTGTLLSDFTVLTAGHLVKNDDNAFFDLAKLHFVPAMNHLSRPFGIYDWCYIRAVNNSTANWALISLVEPAGQSVGFLGAHAQSPIDNWIGDRSLAFFGLPTKPRDEIWIDETVEVVEIEYGARLQTNMQTMSSQVGGPLVRGWLGNDPQVVATLVSDGCQVSPTNIFMPGSEAHGDESWIRWLCDEFGRLHTTDRFQLHSRVPTERVITATETFAMQPDYTPFCYYADDDGPAVRYGTGKQPKSRLPLCLFQTSVPERN